MLWRNVQIAWMFAMALPIAFAAENDCKVRFRDLSSIADGEWVRSWSPERLRLLGQSSSENKPMQVRVTGLRDGATETQGELRLLQIGKHYGLFELKDAQGSVHYFDSQQFNLKIRPVGAAEKPLKISKGRTLAASPGKLDGSRIQLDRLRAGMCANFMAIYSNPALRLFMKKVEKDLRKPQSSAFRDWMDKQCKSGQVEIVGDQVPWKGTAITRSVQRDLEKNPLNAQGSELYGALPTMFALNSCLNSDPMLEQHLSALGLSMTMPELSHLTFEMVYQASDPDWADLKAGHIGTLAYILSFPLLEANSNVRFAEICGK